MTAQQWRSRGWQRVLETVDAIRGDAFAGSSAAVAARLGARLDAVEELARNVVQYGSSVDSLLCETLTRELDALQLAQLTGWGAILLVRWPVSLSSRLRLAEQLNPREWAELEADDPRRMKAIRRDLLLSRLLLGPSGFSLILADRLEGGIRREPSPTTEIALP